MVHISNEGFIVQLQQMLLTPHQGKGGSLLLTQKRGALPAAPHRYCAPSRPPRLPPALAPFF